MEGQEELSRGAPGHIEKEQDSTVAQDTCNGINYIVKEADYYRAFHNKDTQVLMALISISYS